MGCDSSLEGGRETIRVANCADCGGCNSSGCDGSVAACDEASHDNDQYSAAGHYIKLHIIWIKREFVIEIRDDRTLRQLKSEALKKLHSHQLRVCVVSAVP